MTDTMHMERRYIDAADVAKLIRAAIKEAFPTVKFAVRTSKYSGGASIDVNYEDGPPLAAVEAITKRYAGSYFDGMIDYQGSIYHLLDGAPVRLQANFIFTSRHLSTTAMRVGVAAYVAAGHAVEDLGVEEYQDWRGKPCARLTGPQADGQIWGADGRSWYAEAAIATWYDHGRPAAELEPVSTREFERLQITGDDGYSAQCGSGFSVGSDKYQPGDVVAW